MAKFQNYRYSNSVNNRNSKAYKNWKEAEKNEDNKEKKHSLIFPMIVLIVGFICGAFLYTNKSDGATVIKQYYSLLKEKNYEQMYELVDTDLSKDEFVNKIKNIYDGIEFKDAKVSIIGNTFSSSSFSFDNSVKNDNEKNNFSEKGEENLDIEGNDINEIDGEAEYPSVTYSVSANSVAGEIKFTRTSKVVKKDGKTKIKWSLADIYPDLEDGEKIRVRNIEAKRGTIFDRNGYTLAKDSEVYVAKLVPNKVNDNTDFSKLSELTGIDASSLKKEVNEIKKKINQNDKVNDDNNSDGINYISLKKFSKENLELKNQLLEINGVLITTEKAREYPRGEAFSLVIGYEQDGDGKTGIEKQFNDKLSAERGSEIYIEDKDGNIKKSIVKKDSKDGNDVKLTIDSSVQEKIYNEFKAEKSTVVDINYKTGEILALVSTPSYDNNKFSIGMTDNEWNSLKNDAQNPMYARFLSTYVPGSSIKPVVGAIGIETNSFNKDDDFGDYKLKWQKDDSWGDFYISTLQEDRGEDTVNNLRNALVYSDNIYFAQAGLKIGKENLCNWFDKFGFNESNDFIDEMQISKYGDITTDKDLASIGFGQANLMVNPILMSSIYSCFANEGNMVKPYIEFEKDEKNRAKIYRQNVISGDTANIIKDDLIQVVKSGTGKSANIEGKAIAGKTGTAEIKSSKDDKNGTEIGWFDSFDDNGNLIVSMIEDVKNKGGSNYVVKKVRNIYAD